MSTGLDCFRLDGFEAYSVCFASARRVLTPKARMAILSFTSCNYADGQAFEADRDHYSGGSEVTSLGTPFAASVRGLRFPHADRWRHARTADLHRPSIDFGVRRRPDPDHARQSGYSAATVRLHGSNGHSPCCRNRGN